MSTPARAFWDSANAHTIDNNDPNAQDKSYAGKPGTHIEQSCCGMNPPVPRYKLGFFIPSILPQVRKMYVDQGLNPDEPWCEECATQLEMLRDEFVEGVPMFVAMLATIASFIPGIGTAFAAVLESGVALAEGKEITEAFVDGIKAALPGGPVAEMAFNAGQAALQGSNLQDIAIASLPIDDEAKALISTGLNIAQAVAAGEPVTKIALDTAYAQLPDYGQRAVQIAIDLKDGRTPEEIIIEQSVKVLPEYARVGVLAGMAVGHAQAVQKGNVPPVALGRVETADVRGRNDVLAASGIALARSNPRIGAHRSSPPSYVKDVASWTRGFDVGIGAAKGLTAATPELSKIQVSLGSIPAGTGFIAGTQLQFSITSTHLQSILQGTNQMPALGRILSAADRAMLVKAAAAGVAMAQNNPQILAARNLNPDPNYKWGFDIATSTCVGNSDPGPGQTAVRTKIGPFSPGGSPDGLSAGSNVAMQGFDVGQALQFGITKALASGAAQSANASVAAGSLATTGMAGTSLSADTKASTMSVLASNPLTRQGAQTAIAQVAADQNKSFITKILEFFGLA